MHFVWQKRERKAQERNVNVGKVYSKDDFKALGKRLYQKWFVEKDRAYVEFVGFNEVYGGPNGCSRRAQEDE